MMIEFRSFFRQSAAKSWRYSVSLELGNRFFHFFCDKTFEFANQTLQKS